MRPFQLEDLNLVIQILRDPRVAFWRKKRIPVDEIRAGIKRSASKLNQWGLGWWLLFDRCSNELIGCVMLQPLEGTREIEIVYHLRPACWGKGYGSEAARHILRHGFEMLGLTRIRAIVLPRNRPSLRIIEKLGFTQRGMLWHANFQHRYYQLEQHDYLENRQKHLDRSRLS